MDVLHEDRADTASARPMQLQLQKQKQKHSPCVYLSYRLANCVSVRDSIMYYKMHTSIHTILSFWPLHVLTPDPSNPTQPPCKWYKKTLMPLFSFLSFIFAFAIPYKRILAWETVIESLSLSLPLSVFLRKRERDRGFVQCSYQLWRVLSSSITMLYSSLNMLYFPRTRVRVTGNNYKWRSTAELKSSLEIGQINKDIGHDLVELHANHDDDNIILLRLPHSKLFWINLETRYAW